MRELQRVANISQADANEEVVPTINRKVYPFSQGLHNIRRMLAPRNPKGSAVNDVALIDDSFMRRLDRASLVDENYP